MLFVSVDTPLDTYNNSTVLNRFKETSLLFTGIILGTAISLTATLAIAHGGDTDKVHACVDDTTGAIRIVGEDDTCPGGEHSVDWDKSASDSANLKAPFTCNSCEFGPYYESTFKGKNLSGMYVRATKFTDIDLTGTIFKHGSFVGVSKFIVVNATNTDFSDTTINSLSMSGSTNLTNANFTNATIRMFTFEEDTSDFTNANFTNATFSGSDLRGAANMGTANFSGTIWSDTVCPDGTYSGDNSDTCIGHLTL